MKYINQLYLKGLHQYQQIKTMDKNNVLSIATILLVLLGIAMIYIGGFYAPKVMLPPIITGVGFFIIAWVLTTLKK